MIHLVALSSEHDIRIGSPQYNWFEADLQHVNRTRTPWLIVSLHRPMYIDSTYVGTATSDQSVAQLLRTNVEPLFWKYKVNVGACATCGSWGQRAMPQPPHLAAHTPLAPCSPCPRAGLYGHNHAVQRLSAAFGETQYIQRSVPVVHADDGQTWWTHVEPQATLHMVRAAGKAACALACTFHHSTPRTHAWH